MRPRLVLAAVLTAAVSAAAGCGADQPATPPQAVSPTPAPSPSASALTSLGTPLTTTAGKTTTATAGWEITVYYTAVEDFHSGADTDVTGCTKLDCTNGQDDLGTYPSDFVQAVKDEGTGHTSAGPYLNWSYDIGFWLDSEPRTSDGERLTPFASAAADPTVLPQGTHFTIASCGTQDDGSAPQEAVCAALRDGAWEITDEFTPGLGGSHHIDAYIGPETGADFTSSDWYITLTNARLAIG
ncbi:hypothetical protein [Actinoplanes sp. L3-i22]|uniref:hypothetical protein n=1 Tax=Actinoplanes sp. L3-i22 TaxID=2836373 RepID=UPI001C765ABD|nr:hypothetical protein [Actinoplanes sp. L3-i22]BCY12034.1 hypothetical protein L3i22_071220 [Actinoplanes sp. L3-i22]